MYNQKPWLKFYEPHVPARLDYPEKPLPDVLADNVDKYPDQPMVIFKGKALSYREMNRLVDRFCSRAPVDGRR